MHSGSAELRFYVEFLNPNFNMSFHCSLNKGHSEVSGSSECWKTFGVSNILLVG